MSSSRGMTCRELTQEVTAYLEGALPPCERDRFEAHRRSCPTCRLHVAQWQAIVGSLGRLEDRRRGAGVAEKERLVTLFRERGLHRPGRPHACVPTGLGDDLAAPGDHIAYLLDTDSEFTATAGFVAAGAAQGETCVLLGHDETNGRLEAAIQSAGVDVAALRRGKRLRFVSGMNSADALLDAVGEQVLSAVDRGAPLVRILGNLGWGRTGWPMDRDLLQLEARVTDAIRRLPVVLVCAYDVRQVPGRILLPGGLGCHPLIYCHNALRPNEFYIPSQSRGTPTRDS